MHALERSSYATHFYRKWILKSNKDSAADYSIEFFFVLFDFLATLPKNSCLNIDVK